MREQVIDFVISEERWSTMTIKDAYEFRQDRPARWLQRLCLWVLRKLGAFYQRDMVTVQRHVLKPKTFMDRLFKQREEIASLLNREPKVMLIGADDYFELMNEPAIHQEFSFTAQYGKRREILGMEVRVIPWMRGVLVMPS
jgi:hypothetical protein